MNGKHDENASPGGFSKKVDGQGLVNNKGEPEQGSEEIVRKQGKEKRLIYKVSETPPLPMLLLFALQQGLLQITRAVSLAVLVTEVVCGRDDWELKTQILSATFLVTGLSTFCMNTFGIRLPIFQGSAETYVIPLFALTSMSDWMCPTQEDLASHYANHSMNASSIDGILPVPKDSIHLKVRQLSGSLMLAGAIHFLLGLTGLAGYLLKFIGPVTIVPAVTLVGLFLFKITAKFSETNWPVALLVAASGIVLSLYLSKRSTPIPAWNHKRGIHVKKFPVHQVFAVMIAVIIGWLVSALMTFFDLLSADRDSVQFYARTDTQLHIIHNSPWFSFPYPGKFGFPSFHGGVFLSFFIAMLLSVLDSINNYNACARMCFVPQPPTWAVNRGIAVEGLMSLLSGLTGAGHAAVSIGGDIGVIGLTKVASRRVFQTVGLLYILLAVVNKVGAALMTVPYSVLGGAQLITAGIFIGVVLSSLRHVDLDSTRNVAIIGISLLTGLILPFWVDKTPDGTRTGNEEADRALKILLSNPVFVGGFLACFLDNTVPGTLKERGILAEESREKFLKGDHDYIQGDDGNADLEFEEGIEVYDLPWMPRCSQKSILAKCCRICPYKKTVSDSENQIDGLHSEKGAERESKI